MSHSESMYDEHRAQPASYPGALLARERQDKGLTQEYVAGKLNLRIRMIELLENDQYADMPESVFIQGYMRAYAKLLGLSPDPFLDQFCLLRAPEKQGGRILRQKQKEPFSWTAHTKWLAIASGVIMMIVLYNWWAHMEGGRTRAVDTKHTQTRTQDTTLSAVTAPLIDLSAMDPNVSLNRSVQAPGRAYD